MFEKAKNKRKRCQEWPILKMNEESHFLYLLIDFFAVGHPST